MKNNHKKRMTTNGKVDESTGKITYRYPPRYNEVIRGTKIPNDGTDELKQNLTGKRGLDAAKNILTAYYNEQRSKKKN